MKLSLYLSHLPENRARARWYSHLPTPKHRGDAEEGCYHKLIPKGLALT